MPWKPFYLKQASVALLSPAWKKSSYSLLLVDTSSGSDSGRAIALTMLYSQLQVQL